MDAQTPAVARINQAVPFFHVRDMQASLRFYIDGLGGFMTKYWDPDGVVRWCWIELGQAAVMLQQWNSDWGEARKAGDGLSICFMCDDAIGIWREAKRRGLDPSRPMVGNGLWVTSLTDPDGYRLDFESPTDAEEETEYEGD